MDVQPSPGPPLPDCRGQGSVWARAWPRQQSGESVWKDRASLTRPDPGGVKGSAALILAWTFEAGLVYLEL